MFAACAAYAYRKERLAFFYKLRNEIVIKAKKFVDNNSIEPKIITLNAWNEWSEGSYLEPDTVWEYGYLEAVKHVFPGNNNQWPKRKNETYFNRLYFNY